MCSQEYIVFEHILQQFSVDSLEFHSRIILIQHRIHGKDALDWRVASSQTLLRSCLIPASSRIHWISPRVRLPWITQRVRDILRNLHIELSSIQHLLTIRRRMGKSLCWIMSYRWFILAWIHCGQESHQLQCSF